MCEQCSAKTVELGEVMPGWRLIRATQAGNMMKEGDYGLLVSDDPDVVFSDPMIDITEGMLDDQVDALNKEEIEEWMKFANMAQEFEKKLLMSPPVGHDLFKSAVEAGYNREKDGRFSFWLFDHLARFIDKQAKGGKNEKEASIN